MLQNDQTVGEIEPVGASLKSRRINGGNAADDIAQAHDVERMRPVQRKDLSARRSERAQNVSARKS